jgi:hypothetical protein
MSFSLKLIFTSTPVATHTFKETKTDALYEIKVTQKVAGKETGAGTFSFKKGDGSYIDVAAADDDEVIKPSDYTRMKKL